MPTLKQWILDEMRGETPISVVIGEMGWGNYRSESVPLYDKCPKGVVISWSDALPFIEYEFDSGYGAPECQAIVAWSENWIVSVYQYDGSTAPFAIPRNPFSYMPEMPGG